MITKMGKMSKITEEVFVSAIEAVRLQTKKDIEYASALEDIFKLQGMSCYDNALLVKTTISLLQVHFPRVDGFCAIEHYCFELNFGKVGEDELITIEDLWHELTKKDLTSTHPFMDNHSRLFDSREEMVVFHSETKGISGIGYVPAEIIAKTDGYGTFSKPKK